jgi:hypothetical protein
MILYISLFHEHEPATLLELLLKAASTSQMMEVQCTSLFICPLA